MSTVRSKDGTTIAYDKVGSGPAVILVDGAMGYRASFGQGELAAALADEFTAYSYDRRGRGESGDTLPFAVECEIEDIEALIDTAGGSAYLYGISSGAALAMEAAVALGDKVQKLAMYEAPYNSDVVARQAWRKYRQDLDEALAAGRPGDGVLLFMMLVGMPAEEAPAVRQMPMWPALEAVGHTLAYDAAALGDEADVPLERAAQVAVPTLVMNGSDTYPFMQVTALALTEAMPNAQHRILDGQTHEVSVEALAPVLTEFFGG